MLSDAQIFKFRPGGLRLLEVDFPLILPSQV
jgi:hypothetical protein